MLTYDILIVGSGGAGLYAALEARQDQDLQVAVLTKVYPTRSHTGAAQGGVNAALGNYDPSDSWEDHWFDTVKGSDYLADQDAAEMMCREAPTVVRELEHWGAPFYRTDEGLIAQRPFGGASKPRACYAADKVGHIMLHTLYEQGLRHGVDYFNEWFALNLIHDGQRCMGVNAFSVRTGRIYTIQAKAVILATGGHGRIYWTRTSNAYGNTGDGSAIAYRAGLPLKDMEFIQFHPTGLRRSGILVTEGARGEGGYLLNGEGERFMARYAPDKMELGPRDWSPAPLRPRCVRAAAARTTRSSWISPTWAGAHPGAPAADPPALYRLRGRGPAGRADTHQTDRALFHGRRAHRHQRSDADRRGLCGRRERLCLGAWRQPAGRQLAAGHPRVRSPCRPACDGIRPPHQARRDAPRS
jgi:aspartate oxidase